MSFVKGSMMLTYIHNRHDCRNLDLYKGPIKPELFDLTVPIWRLFAKVTLCPLCAVNLYVNEYKIHETNNSLLQ